MNIRRILEKLSLVSKPGGATITVDGSTYQGTKVKLSPDGSIYIDGEKIKELIGQTIIVSVNIQGDINSLVSQGNKVIVSGNADIVNNISTEVDNYPYPIPGHMPPAG